VSSFKLPHNRESVIPDIRGIRIAEVPFIGHPGYWRITGCLILNICEKVPISKFNLQFPPGLANAWKLFVKTGA
jgi:hypothetical protein